MRTDLSEEQVATIGKSGCIAVSHAREREGGTRGERSDKVPRGSETEETTMTVNYPMYTRMLLIISKCNFLICIICVSSTKVRFVFVYWVLQ